MFTVEKSGTIDRPIAEVFAYIGDQTNGPQWQAGLVEVRRTSDGPPGIGTTHALVRTFMGRRMEATNEYVAYEPNNWIAFKSTSGPVPFEASYRLEATEGGTRVTSKIEMRPTGINRLLQPVMKASLKREMDAAVVELKHVLEARGLSSATSAPDPR
jgi:uncharacterized protein YndB with AHSA1/START domain